MFLRLVTLLFFIGQNLILFSQTVFSVGSVQRFVDLRVSQFLTNKSQVGIYYSPRFMEEFGSYIGPCVAYNIITYGEENFDIAKWHPYFCASVGAIINKKDPNELGGHFSVGISYGAKNYGCFAEIGIGKMPSHWGDAFNNKVTTFIPVSLGYTFSINKKNKNMYLK
jgi:hypothetical protein